MPSPSTCQAGDFFVLRSPGLPLDALDPQEPAGPEPEVAEPLTIRLEREREALRQVLRGWVERASVREAIALASPDLASRLGAWREGALEPPAARGVERALLKYLSRMSHRATPFGLFAAVSTGAWGAASRLSVGPWLACRKAVRLDWGVLETLVGHLEQEPRVRTLLRYRPNSSLYACGGWYRYLEHRDHPGTGRTYHLEAVEATPHLDHVLQQAQGGACLADLVTGLAGHLAVEPAEAQAFLERIIEAQVLCAELHPPVTSPDPLGHVVAGLRADPDSARRAEPLAALGRDLKALAEAPLGSHPEGQPEFAAALAMLGIPAETRDVLQVDLFRPAAGLALAPGVRRALEEGAETLRRLTPTPVEGPLERFRAAFRERYETRWMPLLEVLDEENGIGFDGAPAYDSPLLEGLAFEGAPPAPRLSRRDRHLLAQLPRWQGALTWDLDEADVAALANPDPQPFPASFAALVSLAAPSLAALDQGAFQFWMEHYSGPTAARWLGRFAPGEPGLEAALRDHLRKEEAQRPEAVFAEVVHVPEGRMGNVLARPALRDYEIPFLATSGVPAEATILPSDLQVTVRGDRVVLASTRLGREVVPRLSSAHNFARGPVVYRFLARLQDQDGRPGGWSWGPLAEQPFLPRVTRGRQVLSKARWRVEAQELKEALAGSAEGAWGAFQALRNRRGLPRFVLLTEADNSLLVDLDQVLRVEMLHHLVAHRSAFTLTECFPEPAQSLVTSPEGRFAHELVIPFEGTAAPRPQAVLLPAETQAPTIRAYPPGSEWLYLKLYCGPASAERLLTELEPLLRLTKRQGLWDRWHFIRYRDPHPHLRLRFHGVPFRLFAELLPLLHKHLEKHQAQGLLWKWQVDTFEPEWERYGGPLGFALAEAWFFEDSQQVLNRLVAGLTQESRWRMGLRDTDAIWAALGLSARERHTLALATRTSFRKEFGDAGGMSAQMGSTFRGFRKELEAGFPLPDGAPGAPGFRSLVRIREACEQGVLHEAQAGLAGSLAHMHLNRLFRANPREHEWVLMEFLARLYDSHLARHPGTPEPVSEISAE
ncbi:lantibiotic dehydratase [Geothrix oryzisoli]|uniref:lantibiotic dehydratase n=1 Tax=Geothrix oryzisoli TaxID=2922721 RepID=UPI001FAD5C98|nr:lantibiotic dehydratase [Geothrix oryzisoli]